MDGLLLLLCMAASGLWTIYSLPGRHFHFVDEYKTMAEAQGYCRERYADLASISSSEEMDLLISMSSSDNVLMWIGLYDDINSWRWSLQDRNFYSDAERDFRNWAPGEPNNFNSREHCAVLWDDDSLWYDAPCSDRRRSICSQVTGSDVSFVLNPTLMTWSDAQSYCREHHTDLASVRNMEENNHIHSLVPHRQAPWIGLYREPWKWTDGSNSSFRFWNTDEPNNGYGNESCVAASFGNSGRWEDWPCDRKRAFICYSAPVFKQLFKVRLTKSSSNLDLNDPAVLEAILKQLKQKLKDQGVEEDLKLSWRTQSDRQVFHQEKKKEQKKRRKRWITKREEL